MTQQGAPKGVSGIVVSEDGAPVVGVKIFARGDVTTDVAGRFDLSNFPTKNSVIYFQKEGFRPKALVVKPGTATMKVVLEDDSKTAWFLPLCESKATTTSLIGYELRFVVPTNLEIRKIGDIDYQEYLVGFAVGTRRLQLWWGPLVSPGETVEDLILHSAVFEERSIRRKSGETVGYDRWGRTTPDGTAWRSADFPGLSGTAIYEDVSTEAETAYDRIINSACQFVPVR
jgi:hypothetical protein